jgi:hypothetical protein
LCRRAFDHFLIIAAALIFPQLAHLNAAPYFLE